MTRCIRLFVALAAVLILAGLVASPASAAAKPKQHPDARAYLALMQDWNDRVTAANSDMMDHFTAAQDDPTLLFDFTWQAEVGTDLDAIDAVYAELGRVVPPAKFAKVHRLYKKSIREYVLAGVQLRRFFVDYDVTHIQTASDHIQTATDYLERATDELTRLGGDAI